MTPAERQLISFLRATALVLLTAALAVVMPHAWMEAIHAWLGFDALPNSPLVAYLARSLSALYALIGAWCWFVSRDVRRYLPLLRFSVLVTLVFDVTLIAVDLAVEMPIMWLAIEGPFVLAWTFALWALVRRANHAV
jgi:hypothetical protein